MRFVCALVLFAAVACSQSATPPSSDLAMLPPGCGGDGGMAFSSVQAIFTASCALTTCHDNDPQSPDVHLDLRAGFSRQNLVGVAASERCDDGTAPALLRVQPGAPDQSYLYHKLTDDPPCVGKLMPFAEIPIPLPACQIDVIRHWIETGAPQ